MNDTTKQAVSAAILAKVAQGMNVREAIDSVIGAGTVAGLINEFWAACQVKGTRDEEDAATMCHHAAWKEAQS